MTSPNYGLWAIALAALFACNAPSSNGEGPGFNVHEPSINANIAAFTASYSYPGAPVGPGSRTASYDRASGNVTLWESGTQEPTYLSIPQTFRMPANALEKLEISLDAIDIAKLHLDDPRKHMIADATFFYIELQTSNGVEIVEDYIGNRISSPGVPGIIEFVEDAFWEVRRD